MQNPKKVAMLMILAYVLFGVAIMMEVKEMATMPMPPPIHEETTEVSAPPAVEHNDSTNWPRLLLAAEKPRAVIYVYPVASPIEPLQYRLD